MLSRPAEFPSLAAPRPSTILIGLAGSAILPAALAGRTSWAQGLLLGAFAIAGAMLAFRQPRFFWWLTLALAPLALDLPTSLGGIHLTLPLEAMLVLGVCGLLYRERAGLFPKARQAGHWMSLLVVAQIGWIGVAGVFSTSAAVSLKFAIVRVLYVGCFYVLTLRLMEEATSLARGLVAIGAGFIPVIALALARVAASGFEPRSVYESAQPFFQNRVDLCAALCLWLLPAFAVWRSREALQLGATSRVLLAISLVAAAAALIGLRGRAALGALVVASLMAFLVRRLPSRFVVALVVFGVVGTAAFVGDLVAYRSDIARPGATREPSPLRSALLGTSVFSDESFIERANRWGAAARMGLGRPLTGFGPGTFERRYALFQNPWETTPRSTWGGDAGDAHSEWMTALAEQGLPGLALLLVTLSVAMLAAARAARRADRRFFGIPSALAGSMAAFFVLNGPNSLLDVDKVVLLFWIGAAAAVNLDLQSSPGATSPADR